MEQLAIIVFIAVCLGGAIWSKKRNEAMDEKKALIEKWLSLANTPEETVAAFDAKVAFDEESKKTPTVFWFFLVAGIISFLVAALA